MLRRCVMCKNGCSPLRYITVISLEQICKDPSITFIPLEILYKGLVGVYFSLIQFVLCKNGYSLPLASCYELSPLYVSFRQKKPFYTH